MACAKLQFRNQDLMAAMLQGGQQLWQSAGQCDRQQGPSHKSAQQYADQVMCALCSVTTHLNMQQLAPQALQLVAASGIHQRHSTHQSNLRHLWVFHSWLLQHQLLDGQGLAGLVAQEQLQQGQQGAAQ